MNRILSSRPGFHLVLDLHNVFAMAHNTGFDAREYLRRIDAAKIVELHVSGGRMSPPEWLASGRSLRIDSHDRAVPEEVWALAEEILPRCTNLRGITLERMEQTVMAPDVPIIRDELHRARDLANSRR